MKMAAPAGAIAREVARRQKEEDRRKKELEKRKLICLKEKLIREVEKRPIIWDRRCEKYRKKNETEDMWIQISSVMNMPPQWCKKTWKGMVDIFRELLSEMKFNPDGSLLTDLRKITWQYFNSMMFIKNVMAGKCSTCKVSQRDGEDSPRKADNGSQEPPEDPNNCNDEGAISPSTRDTDNLTDGEAEVASRCEVLIEDQSNGCKESTLQMTTRIKTPREDIAAVPGTSRSNTPPPGAGLAIQGVRTVTLPKRTVDAQCKKENKKQTDLQDILANELISVNKQMAAISQDPTDMFGNYAVLLIKELPAAKRRKCEEDVLRLINGYIQDCDTAVTVISREG